MKYNGFMATCTDRLEEKLSRSLSMEVDVTDFLKRFTMDTIWQCGFGVDADPQNKPEDEYFRNCELVFKRYRDWGLFMRLYSNS